MASLYSYYSFRVARLWQILKQGEVFKGAPLAVVSGGVRTTIAMHCGLKMFKMAAKVETFRRLYALFFNRLQVFP